MDNKLKVLFISSWYPSRITPMNGDFIQRHAEAVGQFCYVDFLHVAFDSAMKKKKFEYVRKQQTNYIEHIYYFRLHFPQIKIIKVLKFLYYYFLGYKQVITNLRLKPDIIHCNIIYPNSIIGLLFKKVYKIPYLISEHSTKYLTYKKKHISIQYFISKAIIHNSEFLCPVSNLLKGYLSNVFKANYRVISNVVNDKIFNIGNIEIQKGKIPILHVSSLNNEHKNVKGIINAISKIKEKRDNFKLFIINSSKNQYIENYVAELDLLDYITFLGPMSNVKVAEFMKHVAFVVMFSNYETQGCVILEALMSGIPVVSSNVGGIFDYVNKTNGLLIKTGDENALSDAIDYMIDNYTMYDKQIIRKFAIENFSYEAIGKKFFDTYKEIIE